MSNPFGSNLDDGADGLPAVAMEPAVVRTAPKRAAAKAVITEPRIRIILEENDNIPPTGQFFGLNGTGFLLKPGMAADVPAGIVEILNNAIMSTPVIDPTTKQVTGFRDRLRFPYRITAHLPAPAAA